MHMNTTKSTHDMPLECARSSTKDDEAFLERIDRALSAVPAIASPQRKSRYAIQAVWLWHFHSQRRAYHDVIVQVSDDPQFKQGVTTVYNNDYDNSAGMGKGSDRPYADTRYGLLVNAKGKPGRYIRLYSQGNTANEMNHYIEVEVFGTSR